MEQDGNLKLFVQNLEEATKDEETMSEKITLREYLNDPRGFHLGIAPAFFGFYAYFGALIPFDEDLKLLPSYKKDPSEHPKLLKALAGASAGAIVASFIAAGISPRNAADYACQFDLHSFADPPGFLGLFRGKEFENILQDCLDYERSEKHQNNFMIPNQIEDTFVPLAVTGFDISTMKPKVITYGNIAKAARASASFPGLFQPVIIHDVEAQKKNRSIPSSILIDGGVGDPFGLHGLFSLSTSYESETLPNRIVNLTLGKDKNKMRNTLYVSPSQLEAKIGARIDSLVTINLINTSQCGPGNMENGPKVVEACREAVLSSLDKPMAEGIENGHYELNIDVSMNQ